MFDSVASTARACRPRATSVADCWAATGDFKARKAAVDRVQSIVAEEQPFIFLVYPNTLCAASPLLGNLKLTVLQPDVVSSIETVKVNAGSR